VIFWGNEQANGWEETNRVSRSGFDGVEFVYCHDAEAIEKYQGEPGTKLTLFKNYDDPKTDYAGQVDYDDIKDWVTLASTPLVYWFNDKTQPKIFGQHERPIVLLFVKMGTPIDYYNELRKAATKI